ncbi:hypothetical protein [Actinosynnema sp. NPDC023587]|uniref:hypothetical protein n=1 Tax=Actinosynnema sp. NPDC023587 TaxID=3154695 RepID=UPI0033EFF60C
MMNLLQYVRARRRGGVSCRDERGFRVSLVPVPRPNGDGIDLLTGDGAAYHLRPLEVGRLREKMREALLASENTSSDAHHQDSGREVR